MRRFSFSLEEVLLAGIFAALIWALLRGFA